jgi:hypothetical protein
MMQMLYDNFQGEVSTRGKVIDLSDYLAGPEEADHTPAPRRSAQRRAFRAMVADLLASAGLLLTILLVTVQFL